MNKSTIVGIVLGATAATAVAGIAGYSLVSDEATDTQASVSADQGRTETVAAQNCYEVEVQTDVAPRDDREIAGTVIGAVIGGAVGRDVGDSDLTTAAGAAAGAYAGKKAQQSYQENRTETTTEVRCN